MKENRVGFWKWFGGGVITILRALASELPKIPHIVKTDYEEQRVFGGFLLMVSLLSFLFGPFDIVLFWSLALVSFVAGLCLIIYSYYLEDMMESK